MSDQSDNRFCRQRSSSSEHEIQRELRRQIASDIEAAAECRSWIADSALIQGMREAAEIARGRS